MAALSRPTRRTVAGFFLTTGAVLWILLAIYAGKLAGHRELDEANPDFGAAALAVVRAVGWVIVFTLVAVAIFAVIRSARGTPDDDRWLGLIVCVCVGVVFALPIPATAADPFYVNDRECDADVLVPAALAPGYWLAKPSRDFNGTPDWRQFPEIAVSPSHQVCAG